MGPLFWQSIKGREHNVNVIPPSLVGKLHILYSFSFNIKMQDTTDNFVAQDNMNCHWWKLRGEIQGIAPPSQRNNQQFDAGAKFHVARNVDYVRYL